MSIADERVKECQTCAMRFFAISKQIANKLGMMAAGYMYPCITNAAFTCKLFMKAILMIESPKGKVSHTHDLAKLFKKLSAHAQLAIEATFNQKQPTQQSSMLF